MDLFYKRKNTWKEYKEDDKNKAFNFCDKYMNFLDLSKTERDFVKNACKLAKEKNFLSCDDIINESITLKQGMKIFHVIKNKAIIFGVLGSEPLEKGFNIIGAHIDSPRLDLKQNPLYEDTGFGMLETHYYGGIKKYQWTAIPLSLHGVVVKKDGQCIDISIGEDDRDPIFTITDLLPHLAKDQMEKKMAEGITGEELNILCGSIPINNDKKDDKEKVKKNLLNLLNKKYGFKEEDFISAEIEAVPQFKARSVGFDESMVGAYGQDDRVCSYAALEAILGIDNPKKTCICILTDKEEIGSVGNTGAYSNAFETFVEFLFKYSMEKYDGFDVRYALNNSKMLSADVNAGVDPNFDVQDKKNASYLGNGVVFQKYTGSRGKSGGSDANAEYVGYLRNLLDDNNIIWQSGELGKVDQGGGGTIAYLLAKYGIEVIDCGVPVLSMHAPLEVTSKGDIYEMYKASKVFFESI